MDDWDIIIDPMNTEKEFFVTVHPLNTIFRESCYYRNANGVLHTVKNGMPHLPSVFFIPLPGTASKTGGA